MNHSLHAEVPTDKGISANARPALRTLEAEAVLIDIFVSEQKRSTTAAELR
jgi:hypothetical protein